MGNKLHTMLEENRLEDFKTAIISSPVDINAAGGYIGPPLYLAVWNNNLEAARFVLSQPNVDVNLDGGAPMFRQSPLFLAVQKGNLEMVKLLLQHPTIDVNKGYYNTPLMCAIQKNREDILRLLLSHRLLDPNHGNGFSIPIFKAMSLNLPLLVELLVEHPALQIFQHSAQLLSFAIKHKHASLMRALAQHSQVDINQELPDTDGSMPSRTALYTAILLYQFSVTGSSPFQTSCWVPDIEDTKKPLELGTSNLEKPLLNHKADLEGHNTTCVFDDEAHSRSEAQIIATRGLLDALLSSTRLDVTKGQGLHTPLHLCSQLGLDEIISKLLQKTDSPHSVLKLEDNSGLTPLDIAKLWSHSKVVAAISKIAADGEHSAAAASVLLSPC